MKQLLSFGIVCLLLLPVSAFAQQDTITDDMKKQVMEQLQSKSGILLSSSGNQACDCITKIKFAKKSRAEVNNEMAKCIDKEVGPLQMIEQMMKIDTGKNNTIFINQDKNSSGYKQTYYKLERWILDSCAGMRVIAASENKQTKNSMSNNKKALEFYEAGVLADRVGDNIKAIYYYRSAVEHDKNFAFAWDNLGVNYRKAGRYEDAVKAYKTSLQIDPKGVTGLHNIPVVYEYQQKYDEALQAYLALQAQYPNDPEGYYGAGRMYLVKKNNEEGLRNMCKAYLLYIESKSPYRTDAESTIGAIYQEMKKAGEEAKFDAILKENNIKTTN